MPDDVAESGLSDLRNSVSEAWAKLDPTPESTPEAPVEPAAASAAPLAADAPAKAEASPDGPARGPDGKFTKKEAGEASKGTPAPRASDSGAQDEVVSGKPGGLPPAVAPTTPPAPVSDLKAPQDWRPAAKDKWPLLPREIQEEAIRLHLEAKKTLQDAAEPRKLREVVAPYEHLFKAAGIPANQAIGNILQRYAALTTAPQHVRADILGQLVRETLGTDEAAITALANAIERKGVAAPQQQFDPNQVQAMIRQQLETERRESLRSSAMTVLQQFEATQPEHLESVRKQMGVVLNSWEMENPTTPPTLETFQQAYETACLINPEVRAIAQQKEAAKAAEKANASTQRAKAASVSVKSQPGGPAARAAPGDDIRSHVEAAWERAAQ